MFEHPYDDMSYGPPSPRRRLGRKLWLVMGGLALAVGAVVVVSMTVLPALAAARPGSAANVASGQVIGLSGSRPAQTSAGTAWSGMPAFGGRGGGFTVTGVSGSPVTITATNRKGTTVTIHTTASTTYSRAGQTVSASAVTKGERIGVRGTRNSTTSITASGITIVLPTAGGKITAIASGSITVTGRGGATMTINTSSSTKYVSISRGSSGPVQATIARGTLKVGDFIFAQGTQANTTTLNALTVAVVPAGTHAGGHGAWGGSHSSPASTSTASE